MGGIRPQIGPFNSRIAPRVRAATHGTHLGSLDSKDPSA